MHWGSKATNFFFQNIMVNFIEWNLADSGEIIDILILTRCLNHAVLISNKFHGDWPHDYKTILGKVWAIANAYRKFMHAKVMGVFTH